MKIYNSLTRSKEELIPLNDNIINIYTCGVTVYDKCHIGHARSLYIFDVIRRYLEYKGYKVNFVRNITDIDDKIIKRSNELGIRWDELVERCVEGYEKDMSSLGIASGITDKNGQEPMATKNIPDIIEYIKALIDKGYAYESGGDVYFEVRKFENYGRLSGQDIEKMREAVRISPGENKKGPLDFALWKKSKQGEPSWESPWSQGRPGWHIECSVMSQKFLKADTIDIHAGGVDLIFPHHENEIAQSEAFSGKVFARYWMHNGLVTIDGRKMSKSIGNFITIEDALKKHSADSLKLLFLQAHYSSPVDFTEKKAYQSEKALSRFHIFFDKIRNSTKADSRQALPGPVFKKEIGLLKSDFMQAMDDDFNTPSALGRLFDMLSKANSESKKHPACLVYAGNVITELAGIFGLHLSSYENIESSLESYVQDMIRQRDMFRRNKDFTSSDRIRDELKSKGIILEDNKGETQWRKI